MNMDAFNDFVNGLDMGDMAGDSGAEMRRRYDAKLEREARRMMFLRDVVADENAEMVDDVGGRLAHAVDIMLSPFVMAGDEDVVEWTMENLADGDFVSSLSFVMKQGEFIGSTRGACDLISPLRDALPVAGAQYDNPIDEMLYLLECPDGLMLPLVVAALMNVLRQFGSDGLRQLLDLMPDQLRDECYRWSDAFCNLYAEFTDYNHAVMGRVLDAGARG